MPRVKKKRARTAARKQILDFLHERQKRLLARYKEQRQRANQVLREEKAWTRARRGQFSKSNPKLLKRLKTLALAVRTRVPELWFNLARAIYLVSWGWARAHRARAHGCWGAGARRKRPHDPVPPF